MSIKGHNSVVNLRKTKIYITNVDLVNDNVYTKFGLNLSIRSQDMEQKPNSDIKGCNSVANLQKTMIYNSKVDLVNDNVYTKFVLNRSIRFQDIEQKLNSDVNQGPKLCCIFAKIRTHPSCHACPLYLQE